MKRPRGASTATRPPNTQAESLSNGANCTTASPKVSTSTAAMPATGPTTGLADPVPIR